MVLCNAIVSVKTELHLYKDYVVVTFVDIILVRCICGRQICHDEIKYIVGKGVQTMELHTKGNVTVMEGQSVTLRCDCSEDAKIALVEWKKSRNKTKLAVYSPNGTHHHDKRIRMEVNNHHSTISIKKTVKEDEDWYFCIFQTFPNGKQEYKIYLNVNDSIMLKDLYMRKVPIYISVLFVGAAVVLMIIVLVIWKKKRKPAVKALYQKPQKNMPFYENVDNVPDMELDGIVNNDGDTKRLQGDLDQLSEWVKDGSTNVK
ncbi:T-cell immunoreceptor with Ig and ITIM domains-like [Chiloscyllium plagiosum]|uniref:T-cell immunoreceptor with Ig and ITIM domains-like n=1 Tax=Chiloscyllium plagiosum TaxID=36176 RepID=UPI001CB8119D|nr:T-cell immunoreceptor with Ig and ITIM domains-like [Chiloscyllium plagiosum]